jgi:UDP-N-acetylmuramyl-tripeptide synthetase/UDP-N-acetylmuramoyl-tripeptide--D-alanyl-D-alanine ligase
MMMAGDTAEGGAAPERKGGYSGIASDSRAVQEGYLFAALPGARGDGADYMADAVARGATAILGAPSLRARAERLGVEFLADENPRARLAREAARFFGAQPKVVAAVTGTNGKTSVSVFLRQIWEHCGRHAASLGTIGIVRDGRTETLAHTTPDPIVLHRLLAELARSGTDHLALEASSHGLDQHRLDGVRIVAAAFTNITRDHLDYHGDFESYLRAKLRLFAELLSEDGSAVVNADADHAYAFMGAARARGVRSWSVGARGETIRLLASEPHAGGQTLRVAFAGRERSVALPLAGAFQASNALVAAALAIACGEDAERVFEALGVLKGAAGRLERVAETQSGAPIYVDYAHTPDALETVLAALRPHVDGRLSVVFGCGGDRDRGKRPLMGDIAARLADRVIVTDDNPRSETASDIRHAILAASPGAREIADRAEAIATAIAELEAGDCLVVAGKGHETGQIVGPDVFPFSDRAVAVEAAQAPGRTRRRGDVMSALWTSADAEAATLGHASRAFTANGLSIDTRTLKPGDLFVALKGDARDGHDFVAQAFAAKAAAALVARDMSDVAPDAALLTVSNTLRGLEDLARAARARTSAQIAAVTGSAGKTTVKEMLRLALGALGSTHASAASYNNHWGVPLSLAALPPDAKFGVFEIGMNHFGEIRALVGFVRPHVAMVTTIAPAHIEFFGTCAAIADAKSEIFEGLQSGGTAIVPADSDYAEQLKARARQAGVTRILTFGETSGSDGRLLNLTDTEDGMTVECAIAGCKLGFSLAARGIHNAGNAVGALLAVHALGGDVAAAADALAGFSALKGRGAEVDLPRDGGTLRLIDESYNANPASMRAALANLARISGARRIAVLGDMLELGPQSAEQHTDLADAVARSGADRVFLAGPEMAHLWEKIPPERRGAHAHRSADIADAVCKETGKGDVVLVKGSLGSRMSVIVERLRAGR